MKNCTPILFFLMSFLAYQTAFTQEDFKTNKMVITIFKALKNQNEKKILKSLPNKKDILYLIPLVRAAKPHENIPEVDSIISNFKVGLIENFRKVTKKGIAFGINWEDITLKEVKYVANPDPTIEIERANITLLCTSNNIDFLIILKKCYKIQNTWRLMNTIKFTLS